MNNTTALLVSIFFAVAAACLGTGYLIASIVAGIVTSPLYFAAAPLLFVIAAAGWMGLYQIKQTA